MKQQNLSSDSSLADKGKNAVAKRRDIQSPEEGDRAGSSEDERPIDWYPYVAQWPYQAEDWKEVNWSPQGEEAWESDPLISLLSYSHVRELLGLDLQHAHIQRVYLMARHGCSPRDVVPHVSMANGEILPADHVNRAINKGFLLHHIYLITNGVDCEDDPDVLFEIVEEQREREQDGKAGLCCSFPGAGEKE